MPHTLRVGGWPAAASQMQAVVDRGLPVAPKFYIDIVWKEG